MGPAGHTFAVDAVKPAPLRREPKALAALEERLGGPLLAWEAEPGALVEVADVHGLLLAAGLAYNEHRPLLLSPDSVWLTLAQGFATHLLASSEVLRARFVRHSGKQVLRVAADEVRTAEGWRASLEAFAAALGAQLGNGLPQLFTCSFSTTSAVARTASQLVLMAGFQRYFDYEVFEICGFPSITLLGTPDDWRDIRRRLEVLREYDAAWWVDPLLPIAEQWIRTAEGKPDRDFWQCLYNAEETYGSQTICGWICRLYPYLDTEAGPKRTVLGPYQAPQKGLAERRGQWLCSGFTEDSVPRGLSTVPIRKTGAGGEELLVGLAGFLGAAQEEGPRGALFPQIGWAVRVDPSSVLWERLLARGSFTAAPSQLPPPLDFVPALLLELSALGEGLSLEGGALVFRAKAALVAEEGQRLAFADLPDGSRLTFHREAGVERCSKAGRRPIAGSIFELFDRLGREGLEALEP
jgi:hypothetical protein